MTNLNDFQNCLHVFSRGKFVGLISNDPNGCFELRKIQIVCAILQHINSLVSVTEY